MLMETARCDEDAESLCGFVDVCISVLQIRVRCLKMYVRQHSLYSLATSAVSVTKKLQDNAISSIRYSVVSVRTLVAQGLFNSWFTRIVKIFSHEPKVKALRQPKVTSACR